MAYVTSAEQTYSFFLISVETKMVMPMKTSPTLALER